MTKLHRVLAAVDFSEPARAAFDHALALSRLHDAELTGRARRADGSAIQVARSRAHRPDRLAARCRASGRRSLQGERSARRSGRRDPVARELAPGRPDRAGNQRAIGFDRFRFGSVAETVALEATQPVLVVPPVSGKAADPMTPFKNILVAVDFGEGSSEAVERALSMANGDSRVTVVHVVRGVPLERASRYLYHLMEPEYQRQPGSGRVATNALRSSRRMPGKSGKYMRAS